MRGSAEERRYWTTTRAAREAHVSPSTLLRAVQAGKLKAFSTPGGHFRIDPASLKEFIAKSRTDGPAVKALVVPVTRAERERILRELKADEGFSLREASSLKDAGARQGGPARIVILTEAKGAGADASLEDLKRLI